MATGVEPLKELILQILQLLSFSGQTFLKSVGDRRERVKDRRVPGK